MVWGNTVSLSYGRIVIIPLSHHLQWQSILYYRESASLVAESTPKLNWAQVGGSLQVPMALRATQGEHIVVRHVFVVFLEDGRGTTTFAWQQRR
jgi:hypothetical protein